MVRRLRIGLVAPPWLSVPPERYGGTETVLDVLARGLLARGHDVTLFTIGDATSPVPRAWVYRHPVVPMGSTVAELFQVTSAYERLVDCDVIHDHTDAGPVWAAGKDDLPPVVATNHNTFSRERRALYAEAANRGVAVVAISHDQRSRAGDIPGIRVVHNGIDTSGFRLGPGTGGYALFVGRLCPDKGADQAIAIARRAGVPLRIAGKMWATEEREYFDQLIRPQLGADITYIGEIGSEERAAELGGAVALLNPIQWDEPFGLVMVEAMACGTPVIAFDRGAAPEIIAEGVSGRVVSDVDSAAYALGAVASLDRRACRRHVERWFSGERMVGAYEAVYREVLARRSDVRWPAAGA